MAAWELELDFNCVVCLNLFEDPTLLVCGHTFCRGCLETIYNKGRYHDRITCPECRKVTNLFASGVDGLPPNIALKRLYDTANINDVTDTDDVNDDYDDDYDDDDDDERDLLAQNILANSKICSAKMEHVELRYAQHVS